MNQFDQIDDFDYALKLAMAAAPDVNLTSARRENSSWDNQEVRICDRDKRILASFDSAEYLNYCARISSRKTGPTSSGTLPKKLQLATTIDPNTSSIPRSARTARAMIAVVKTLSVSLSILLGTAGLAFLVHFAFIGSFLLGIVAFIGMLILSLINHWTVRLMYIGLEMIADIVEDIRAIRLMREV